MKPVFDIDALRTIVVGSELGSFARAAIQLGRSQSAVSMQLKCQSAFKFGSDAISMMSTAAQVAPINLA